MLSNLYMCALYTRFAKHLVSLLLVCCFHLAPNNFKVYFMILKMNSDNTLISNTLFLPYWRVIILSSFQPHAQ